MKKLLSILLVAMLIIGMFPVTPLTANAATKQVTLTFDNTSKRTTYDTTTKTQVWEENGITLTNSGNVGNYYKPVRLYKNTTVVVACKNMVEISFACNTASYANTLVSCISGSTVSGKIVTVSFAAADEYTFTLSAGQVRMDSLTVTQEITTDCTHETTTSGNDGVPATCTEIGYKDSVVCANTECGVTITERTVIDALGHSYSEGSCANCGNAMIDPSLETKATLMTELPIAGNIVAIYHPASGNVMASAADGSALDAILAEVSGDQIPYDDTVAQLVVGVVDSYYTFKTKDGKYLATDGDGGCLVLTETMDDLAQWTITANGTAWNVINKASTNSYGNQAIEYFSGYFTTYSINSSNAAFSLVFYLVGQDTCQHSNTEVLAAVAATCTESGLTEGLKCSDCGAIRTAQETIDALGHNYVDGICSRCGAEEPDGMSPVTELAAGKYVVVATNSTGSYAMDTTISSKVSAIEVTVDGDILVGTVDEDAELPVWTVEVCGDGWAFTNGTEYLGYGSSGTDFIKPSDAYQWNAAAGTNGFVFTSAAATSRGIFFQESGVRFGAYSTSNSNGYVTELTLYKVKEEAAPVAEVNGTEYTTMDAAIAEITANGGTLKLLAEAASITYDGELYLDLNGNNAVSVTATKIYAYDSTVTTSSTEFATLATESTVEMDYTANGKRYIALKTESGYTFHVLEMQLSAITLRHTEAGIYYKAKIVCDATLAAATKTHGVVLSTDNMPGKDFATEAEDVNCYTAVAGAPVSGKEFTSGSVFGIFKNTLLAANNAARGKIKIYANAYLVLNDGTNDTIVMADTSWGDKAKGETDGNDDFDGIAWSLYDVMVALDATFNENTAAQERILSFYETWSTAMADWNLTNIAAAATPAA